MKSGTAHVPRCCTARIKGTGFKGQSGNWPEGEGGGGSGNFGRKKNPGFRRGSEGQGLFSDFIAFGFEEFYKPVIQIIEFGVFVSGLNISAQGHEGFAFIVIKCRAE